MNTRASAQHFGHHMRIGEQIYIVVGLRDYVSCSRCLCRAGSRRGSGGLGFTQPNTRLLSSPRCRGACEPQYKARRSRATQPNGRPLTSLNAAHRIQMQRQKMTPRPRPRPPAPAITPQNERQGFPICGLKTAATTVDIGYKVIGQRIYT